VLEIIRPASLLRQIDHGRRGSAVALLEAAATPVEVERDVSRGLVSYCPELLDEFVGHFRLPP